MSSRFRIVMSFVLVLWIAAPAAGADGPMPERRTQWIADAAALQAEIDATAGAGVAEQAVADAAVHAKAVEWIARHGEFYKPSYMDWTDEVLSRGRELAGQLAAGKTRPFVPGTAHVCGYRSRVDRSFQPYALTLPEAYDPDSRKRWPVYVVLHGRNGTLTEVSFIHQFQAKKAEPEQQWIQIDVFGRTNNAYRWAGETDVFEALSDARRRVRVDDRRISLWGFSMGGAGAWHLGLHHPSQWSAVGAGAGFVDTYVYQKIAEKLPNYQDEALRIYDAVGYAGNLAMVPFVTYGGDQDAQLLASSTMADLAKEQDVPLTFLIGKDVGHKFTPESKAEFMAFLAEATGKGRPRFPAPREVHFVTQTVKYNSCDWVTVDEQIRPYEKTTVDAALDDAGRLIVTTENVAVLSIDREIAGEIVIDGGDPLPLRLAADGLLPGVYFQLRSEGWDVLDYEESRDLQQGKGNLRKRRDLQGPIDDAFMQPFVCVRGTGTPQSPELNDWSAWTLQRFESEFDKWMRAKPVVIDDTQVNSETAIDHNLIYFGDPGSNAELARIVEFLPVRWDKDQIRIGDRSFSTADHGLSMIYPNPFNPQRYVVINSGHTFHEPQFKASNAQLYPRLGDIAVVKFTADGDGYREETVWAANFDANWRIPTSAMPNAGD